MIGMADIHKSIEAAWDGTDISLDPTVHLYLNDCFNIYRPRLMSGTDGEITAGVGSLNFTSLGSNFSALSVGDSLIVESTGRVYRITVVCPATLAFPLGDPTKLTLAVTVGEEFNMVGVSFGIIQTSRCRVLNDQEASPDQPFPYCVVETKQAGAIRRMTWDLDHKQQIRQVSVTFNVHTKPVEATVSALSAKEIAADLVEKIMMVFGGHPTAVPAELILDSGAHLLTQYADDYPVRTPQYHYQWVLSYDVWVDVPVTV